MTNLRMDSPVARWAVAAGAVCVVAVLLLAAMSQLSVAPARSVTEVYDENSPAEPTAPSQPVLVASVLAASAPEVSGEPPARPVGFAAPSIGVNAPIVELGLDANGNMASPEGPDDVAWYTFTGTPGAPGNAVFSGHLDWYTAGPAVFWRMRELKPGDRLEVRLEDGSILTYAVAWEQNFPLADVPMPMVLEQTSLEAITVITCAGQFVNGDYTERHVLRAVRTFD